LSVTLTGPVGSTQKNGSPLHRAPLHPSAVSYNKNVAPFTKPFARAAAIELLRSMPPRQRGTVLDHGAGTGQVARIIHAARPSLHVHCLDPSENFLAAAPQAPTEPWSTIQVGTTTDLSPKAAFIGAVSNLVMPFVPNAVADLTAIRARLVPGAKLVMTTLGEAAEVEPFCAFWSTLASLSPELWQPERYVHFRFGQAADFQQIFVDAGFTNIKQTTIAGHRPIKAASVWKWLVAEMPIGIGESYGTPPEGFMEKAHDRFMANFGERTLWTTRCRMISCTVD
jgi:SAM-dependent methyltransferase